LRSVPIDCRVEK